jgi:signal transduction histidine kinase/ligand-binding sensor domain-containing protein
MDAFPATRAVRSVCIAAATAVCCFALDPRVLLSQYQKRHWRVEDGLPHNYVMTVLPGPEGFLLVGTDEGLARFDGVRFVPYDLHPSLGLSKRWVLSILSARDGSLWIGTFDGGLYEWRGGEVISRVERGASVFAILEDAEGNIWASTRSGVIRRNGSGNFQGVPQLGRPPDTAWNVLAMDTQGAVWIVSDALYRYCKGTITRVLETAPGTGEVLSVATTSRGVITGTSTGLFHILETGDRTQVVRQPGAPGPVVTMIEDADANLWVGTWGKGLFRVNGGRAGSWSSREGLPDDFVRTLYADREGNLWIGVRGGGLSRWKNPALVPLGIPEGLSGDFASTVTQDRTGDLWLGTWRGGLYRLHDGVASRQPTPVPDVFLTVRAFAVDAHGYAWIGNWEGIARYDGKAYRHFGGPDSLYRHTAALWFDRRGRLWVGTSDQGVLVFDGEPGDQPLAHLLPGREITSLEEDSAGNVWVGTTSGVGYIKPEKTLVFTDAHGLPRDYVAGLSKDSKHRIWACTLSGAIWQLSDTGNRVFDGRYGLPQHPLYRALDDGAGSMWISSPRGILRIGFDRIERALAGRVENLDPTRYGEEDGMRTIECHRLSQPAGDVDRGGNVWFPTTKGFVRIPPGTVLNSPPPPVFIEESITDGHSVRQPDLKLTPGSHNLQIRFTALRFSSPEKLRFRYRMEGYDPDWVADGGARTAQYNRLPPGAYRLVVSASLPGGRWGDPAFLTVHQRPLFHQTGWFLVLLAVVSVGVSIALFRWRLHLVRQRYAAVIAERNRIGREWHDTLVAGFSAISLQLDAALFRLSGPASETREVLEMTQKIVHHYRAEARRVIWDLRDNRPESESLVEAVSTALRQATSGKDIDSAISITGEALQAPREVEHNLLRICQEALSNAIRHGEPRHLRLAMQYSSTELKVRIEDDGKGFNPSGMNGLNGGHFGLTVMEERARRFGGTFRLQSAPGKGTVVEAAIPIAGNRHAG